MKSFYDINQEILDCVDTETGEILDEEKLRNLQMEKKAKIASMARWVKDLRVESEALKEEIARLTARKKSAENKQERLKAIIMDELGGKKFKDETVSIYYGSSQSVSIDDNTKVPVQYLKYAEPQVDRKGLLHDLKLGVELDGIHIVESRHLVIR